VWTTKNFQYSKNNKSLIGVDLKRRESLIQEEIGVNHGKVFRIGENKGPINIVLEFETLNIVLAGDDRGNVKQYDMNQGRSRHTLLKDYGNLGIGNIFSGAIYEHVAVFGGDSYSFRFINVVKRQLIHKVCKSSVKWIRSLEFIKVSQNKIFLSITGSDVDYSKTEGDLFEFTDFRRKIKKANPKYISKRHK
jgi:hypothetical protein